MLQHEKIPVQAIHTKLNPKIPSFEPDRIEIPHSTLLWNLGMFPSIQLVSIATGL